jgi:predicted ABC-type ATPase
LAAPTFYLLAGPNGAGKSTLYRALVDNGTLPASLEFVNADLYEAAHLQQVTDPVQRSEQARAWADARRAECIAQGRSFASETVFSHASKLQLITDARAAGFYVLLLVVGLDDTRQLVQRVSRRVKEGGHAVERGTHRLVARCKADATDVRVQPLPDWARQVVFPSVFAQ